MPSERTSIRTVATNRRARRDYFIDDTYEAGIALTGTEIKSVREGRVNLREGYAVIRWGEAWLMDVHISPYSHGGRENHDPKRTRKLLLHRWEIDRLEGKVTERGRTLVPLRIYLRDGLAKVEIGLARGKREYDKRETIAKRDAEREMRREIKNER
jgi:SsrA-binding protein